MVRHHTIHIREVVKESVSIFRRIWPLFIKFSFYTVLLSFAPSIYRLTLETTLSQKPLFYVLGMALLVVLYILFIYYSVRFTMTSIQKLKAVIEDKPFDFVEKFKKSEDKFWRALFVIFIKGLVQGLAIVGCFFIFLYLKNDYPHGVLINSLTFIPLVMVTLIGLYFSFRLEFYLISVYWNLDESGRDLKISFNITKKQKFKKLIIVLIAQLPTFLIGGFQFWHELNIIESTQQIGTSWLMLLAVVITTVLVFSWSFVVYYVMLSKMGYLPSDEKIIRDEEGREWISY